MSKHPSAALTTAALRDLDPARATGLTDEERSRADATLARILVSPTPDRGVEEPARSRRRRRLLVPVALAGAAGAAVPTLLLGGGSAFASWTATPEPLAPTSAAEAAATCRAALEVAGRGERVVVAEQRGGWTYVLLVGAESEAVCLMPDDLIGREDPADHKDEGFFGTYDTDPAQAPAVGRDDIVETTSTQGSVPTHGRWLLGDGEEWFSSVEGYVGQDVTGVTVHTPVGTDVEASVAGGRFAAWWPSEQPSSKNLDVMGAWTYTVTLSDGSTRQVTG